MCVSACVRTLRISVSLHNKSLLNKCKADGTVVSPPCGEEEREKREGKRGGGGTRLLRFLGLHRHTHRTPYRRRLRRAVKHFILQEKLKVASKCGRTPKHVLLTEGNILFIGSDC